MTHSSMAPTYVSTIPSSNTWSQLDVFRLGKNWQLYHGWPIANTSCRIGGYTDSLGPVASVAGDLPPALGLRLESSALPN